MSDARRSGARVAVAALLASALLTVASGGLRAQDPLSDLPALLAQFRAVRGLTARFREEKRIALLEEPLISEGVLHFSPPARLARLVERPAAAAMVLDGDALRLTDARGTERIDLQRMPVVRAFVDAFRAVLAGDAAALDRAFRTRLRREADGSWTLGLSPRVRAVARAIRWIELSGRDVRIARLRIIEVSGDESRTTFSEVDTTHVYDAAEAQRIFGARPPATKARPR